jgi:hypothetical protein
MAFRTEPILTPKFRARWTRLAEPDEKGKFSITMLFPKDANLKPLKDMVIACIKGEWGDKFKPSQLSLPLKDGNEKINAETGDVYAEYVDTIWATASTKYAVTVLDATKGKKPIPTAELKSAVYDGCYCIAQISAYSWEYKDDKTGKVIKRGVSLRLENLLKYADGEPIGGGKKYDAADAFADIAADADDPGNYQTEEKGSDWDL